MVNRRRFLSYGAIPFLRKIAGLVETPSGVTVTNKFNISGPADSRSMSQIAAAAKVEVEVVGRFFGTITGETTRWKFKDSAVELWPADAAADGLRVE